MTNRIEIKDPADWREGDIAVIDVPRWFGPVEAPMYQHDEYGLLYAAGMTVRGANGVPNTYLTAVYRNVPALPTEIGSVIRATIRGVDGVVAVRNDDDDDAWAHQRIRCDYWRSYASDIDLSTVEVGRIVWGDGDE